MKLRFYHTSACETVVPQQSADFSHETVEHAGTHESTRKHTKCWIPFLSIYATFPIIMCILRLATSSTKKLKLKLLIFLIPIVINLYVVVLSIFPDRMESSFLLNPPEIILIVSSIMSILVVLFATMIYSKKEPSLEFEDIKHYSNLYYLKNNLAKSDYSKSELFKIESAVTRLFLISQDEVPSTINALNVLKKSKLPSNLLHVIMERSYAEDLLRRCSIMTLVEFQQELLPEIFSARKGYRSPSMDMRYYEDFNEKLRLILKNDNRALEELGQKIDYLSDHIEKNLNLDVKTTESIEPYGCQNQIRELFHALETPIATSEMAISNLVGSFDSLTDMQESKFARIENNLKLIKSILFAYRELTFMNIYSAENTFFSLPTIISSMKDIVSSATTNSITIEQHEIPDTIPPYSTNLIVVLILPLIHNAIEASPNKKSVCVNYTESEKGYTIQIKNHYKQLPSQANLDKDGYSSKGNNHVGTGISIVRRISKSVGVEFLLKVDNNQVVAQLVFPKRQV